MNRMHSGDQRVLRACMEFYEENLRVEMVVTTGAKQAALVNQGVIFRNYLDALGVQKGKVTMEDAAYMVAILWDYQYVTVNPEVILRDRDLVQQVVCLRDQRRREGNLL